MSSLLRWLSDLVGSIYVLQVIWAPIEKMLGLDYDSRVDHATTEVLGKRKVDVPHFEVEPEFRFVGTAPSGDAVTALFVNRGAAVTEVSIGEVQGHIRPSDRIASGGSGQVELKHQSSGRDVPFEIAYTDAAGVRKSLPFMYRADRAVVEAVDVLAAS